MNLSFGGGVRRLGGEHSYSALTTLNSRDMLQS